MRLQSVSLFGFKSFADRTELRILPGVTAVVGPNGCGKTNIADGLRWALGEQSPKALRGQRMEDVIFHGSQSRRALGLSEVLLTFSNEGEVSVPWSEISVGRRLYRDGESEYLLNKTGCRLKDIHDLFLGTGVNPKAYALMEQDRLAHILTARPLDRRVFVEEAAGITRYKQQRTETLAKLEATRQNLLRVRDVMDEVRRQLTSLERQAKKAQTYKRLQAERRALELAILAAEHAALVAEETALSAREGTERDRSETLRTHAAAVGAAQELARANALAAEHRAADLGHAFQRADLELEGCLTQIEQIRVSERDLATEITRLAAETAALRERLKSLAEERSSRREQVLTLRQEFRTHQARLTVEEATLAGIRRRLRAAREEAERLRHQQVSLAGRRTALGQVLGGLEERRGQLARRLARLETEREQAQAERSRLSTTRAAVEGRLGEASSRALDRGAALARLAEDADAAAAERAAASEAADGCRVTLAGRRSSLAALEELEVQRAGYSHGVQTVFAAARAVELRGVIGTVADLLDVPPELERAVEAALGERLQWVVMDTFGAAKAALGYLGENGGGQATFLSLDWLNGAPVAHLPSAEGVVGVASGLVGSGHPSLVTNLLGSVVVVQDLRAAERLWGENGTASFVTMGGELLAPPGTLGGGRASGAAAASLLARRRTIRDLRTEVLGLERGLRAAEDRVKKADARVTALTVEQRGVASERAVAEAERLSAAKDLEQVERERERVELLVEACGTEMAEVHAEAQGAATEIEEHRTELQVLEEVSGRVAADVARLLGGIEGDAAMETTRAQAFLDGQVELAGLAGRIQAVEGEDERIASEELEAQGRITGGEARFAGLELRAAECDQERARLEERATAVREARGQAEAAARVAAEALQEATERLRGLGEEVRGAEAQLAHVTQALHGVAVRLAEVRVRREDLEVDARRQFEVTPDALRAAHDPTRDLTETRAQREGVATRIAALEPVNLIADEEYRELEERLHFLRAQHDDLTASMKDLDRALRGMTRTAQERFAEAFEAINRNFQELFARLFEGGRAELRLVEAADDADPLDTGIEMVAQPRGKRLQAISLLSGGEKALTGLALLFAIFYYRPSPFCLLDEVDAPLDDANIHRFTRVLRELSGETQFIVITHNRKTMEAADILYGITMEEPGLSRVVSVNLA